MKKLDTEQLAGSAQKSFALSRDGRLKPAQQSAMLTQGMRLRASLISALSAEFADAIKQVDDANQQLTALNAWLTETNTAITKIADTVKQATAAASLVEKLLKKAVSVL
jgi:ABC-type transporter Mla subunit MlaD